MAKLASERQTCRGAVMENRPDRDGSGAKLTACLVKRHNSSRAVARFGTWGRRAARIQTETALMIARAEQSGVKTRTRNMHDMCRGTPFPEESCTLRQRLKQTPGSSVEPLYRAREDLRWAQAGEPWHVSCLGCSCLRVRTVLGCMCDVSRPLLRFSLPPPPPCSHPLARVCYPTATCVRATSCSLRIYAVPSALPRDEPTQRVQVLAESGYQPWPRFPSSTSTADVYIPTQRGGREQKHNS